jgi:signal transduction histidine kinase/ligand-binding sensor domain-containing protein
VNFRKQLESQAVFVQRFLGPCLVLVWLSTSATALDPSRQISQYGHRAWRIQDGIFSGPPHAITQTADGYLWIGTQSGLMRFDGVRFVPWTPPEGKSLPSSAIYSLLGVSDGSLWIGTGFGLAHWKDGDLVIYQDGRGRINSIVEDRTGAVWITRSRVPDANGPLCQVVGTNLHCYGKADGIPYPYAGPLVEDSLAYLWIGSSGALSRWKPGSSNTYLQKELKQSSEGLAGVEGLAAAEDGSVWVGIPHPGKALGLRQFVNGVSKSYVVPGMDGSSLAVEALFLDRSNALWVGTGSQGIYRVYDGRADHFRGADGLSSDSIYDFYQDREGNLWVVTSKGIDFFRDLRVASFSVREGLTADEVSSVLADHNGTVWIGNSGALDFIRQGAMSKITARDGMPGHDVTSLFEDDVGRLWVGVDAGLAIYEHKQFRLIKKADGSPVGPVIAITEDTDHNIWAETIGSQRSLIRIRDQQVREVIPASQVPRTLRIAADPQGGIWLTFGTGGLARYRDGKLETFSVSQSKAVLAARDLWVDSDGATLAATNLGLFRWKDGKRNILSSRNGLPCDSINAMVRDNLGSLWLSTECGYVVIADSELEKWWKQPDSSVKVSTLDGFDGAQPGAASFCPVASKSGDGRLWFANESIVQMIDPSRLAGNAIPPPVRIEQFVADRKSYSFRGNLRLPPHTRDLEIDYTALSFVVPQKVRFRYRLEGRDADWKDSQTRRQAFYNDLPPGNYKFRVIACNNDGVWNRTGASLAFSIAPAYYQTNWFLALCVTAFLMLLWVFYQMRLRQLHQQFSIGLEARVNERTRIARELHDTLLQSLHGLMFQFQAARNMLPRRPEGSMRVLDDAIFGTEQAIAESRDAIQDLRPASVAQGELSQLLRTVAEELAAAQRPNDNSPAFHVIVEGEPQVLSPKVQHEVYNISREVIRNAFHHANARRIEVEIRYDKTQLRLRFRDDGKGIDPTVLEESRRPGHWGLPGVRERAKRVGSRLEFWSQNGAGTEVELTVPAATAYKTITDGSWLKLFRKAGNE